MESSKIGEIRDLLAKSEIKQAITQLQKLLSGNPLLDDVILQSARYTDLMKQIRKGTLDYEKVTVSKNQITFALIEMLTLLDEAAETNPEVKKALEAPAISIRDSKNVNTGNVNTGGGDFRIGDNN